MWAYRSRLVIRCIVIPGGIALAAVAGLLATPNASADVLVVATVCALAVVGLLVELFYLRVDAVKHERAAAALHESEARFRHLSDTAPIMMWMTDSDQHVSFVSRPWLDFTGLDQQSIDANEIETLRDAVHPEDFAPTMFEFYKASTTRQSFATEYRLRRHDGDYRWVHDSGVPRFEPDGRYAGYVGVVIDIDDRRRAEAALRASEQRLRMLVENVPLVQYVTDKDGTYLLVEGCGLERIGLTPGEGVGLSVFDTYEGHDELTEKLRRALAGESLTSTVEFMDVWWDVYYTPIFGAGGAVAGLTVVGLDVTEREQAKAALEESEMRYKLIAGATIDAIWDLDMTTGRVWRSDGFGHIFGYGPDIPSEDATWWMTRIHPADLETIRQQAAAFIAGTEARLALEYRLLRSDNTYAHVTNRIHAVRNESGAVLRLVGSVTDVTEQRQLEQQFLHAQKMETVGRLAGGIAHDFSNLMTAIMVNAELDLATRPSDETLRADLEDIRSTAERAANLSKQLLAFARRQIVEPRVIDLNDMLENTERMLQRLIAGNIALRVECAADQTSVRIDPGQLEQVLVNMIVNARDAMPEGGEIAIRSTRATIGPGEHGATGGLPEGDYVVLTISDTGHGMDDDVREHVFEPFFTTKGVGLGTGLGLPTSYGIVKQAGGDIVIESRVGHGTTFRIYLPYEAAPASESTLLEAAQDIPRGNETILLVEDEPAVRRSASRALRQLGYNVIEAGDGREGLAAGRAHAGTISLVVTDVVMPLMGGQDMAAALRAARPDLRVLFVSGYTNDPSLRADIHTNDVDFISKPFSPSTLARRVRETLDRPSAVPSVATPAP